MTGTTHSLKLMVQLLTSGQVSGLEADMWMTTLSFIQPPTIDMLSEVKVTDLFIFKIVAIYFEKFSLKNNQRHLVDINKINNRAYNLCVDL